MTEEELRHLSKGILLKLDQLQMVTSAGFQAVVKSTDSLRTDLVGPATGRQQVDLKTHKAIVRELCLAFGAVIFLLTGLKLFGIG